MACSSKRIELPQYNVQLQLYILYTVILLRGIDRIHRIRELILDPRIEWKRDMRVCSLYLCCPFLLVLTTHGDDDTRKTIVTTHCFLFPVAAAAAWLCAPRTVRINNEKCKKLVKNSICGVYIGIYARAVMVTSCRVRNFECRVCDGLVGEFYCFSSKFQVIINKYG